MVQCTGFNAVLFAAFVFERDPFFGQGVDRINLFAQTTVLMVCGHDEFVAVGDM